MGKTDQSSCICVRFVLWSMRLTPPETSVFYVFKITERYKGYTITPEGSNNRFIDLRQNTFDCYYFYEEL